MQIRLKLAEVVPLPKSVSDFPNSTLLRSTVCESFLVYKKDSSTCISFDLNDGRISIGVPGSFYDDYEELPKGTVIEITI